MLPQTHFLFPFLIGLVLTKFDLLTWKFALIAGIVGVVVDIDHYVEHIIHAKSNRFSLKDTWNNSIKSHKFNQRSFIHQINGAWMLTFAIGVLSVYNVYLGLAVALGYYSHLLLDLPHFAKEKVLRLKLGQLYFNESYPEVVLDVILFLGVVLTFVI